MNYQTCTKCKACKPIERFYYISRAQKHDTRCKDCVIAYLKERRATVPGVVEREAEAAARAYRKRKEVNPLAGTWATKSEKQKRDITKAVKRWRAKNKERFNEENRLSIHLRRSWPYRAAWPLIVEHYGGKCLNCGSDRVCFDHVKPISEGGANLITNGQPLCRACNTFKANTEPSRDWRPDKGAWIVELVRLNPQLEQMTEARPQGWHKTPEGVKELAKMKAERGPLVMPEGQMVESGGGEGAFPAPYSDTCDLSPVQIAQKRLIDSLLANLPRD